MFILFKIVIPYIISLLEQVYAVTKADPNTEKCLWHMLLAELRYTLSDSGERLLPFAGAVIFRNLTDSDSESRTYLNFKCYGKESRPTAEEGRTKMNFPGRIPSSHKVQLSFMSLLISCPLRLPCCWSFLTCCLWLCEKLR